MTRLRRPRGSTGISYKEDPREYARRYWLLVRAEAISALGGKCAICSEADPVVLQIDHVDGDGRLIKCPGGKRYTYATMKRVLDGESDGLQLLCANCHCRKTYAQGDHLAAR